MVKQKMVKLLYIAQVTSPFLIIRRLENVLFFITSPPLWHDINTSFKPFLVWKYENVKLFYPLYFHEW